MLMYKCDKCGKVMERKDTVFHTAAACGTGLFPSFVIGHDPEEGSQKGSKHFCRYCASTLLRGSRPLTLGELFARVKCARGASLVESISDVVDYMNDKKQSISRSLESVDEIKRIANVVFRISENKTSLDNIESRLEELLLLGISPDATVWRFNEEGAIYEPIYDLTPSGVFSVLEPNK